MENVRPDSQKLTHLKAPDPIDSPMRVVSLPLHQLQNSQGETPGPMSVLEWRRAVWYAVQSIRDQTNPIILITTFSSCPTYLRPSINIIDFSSPPDLRTSKKKLRINPLVEEDRKFLMADTLITLFQNSDSGEEVTDNSIIGRPSRHGLRRYTSKKPTVMPLIDLTQPTDADGRPIQFEGGRPQLLSQSNKPKKRMMAAPDIEQRHREAMRRLQAEATEHLIYAEWEAAAHHQSTPQFEQPKLNRLPTRRATLRKLSDFARKSVSNLSVRTTAVSSPPPVASCSNTVDKSRSSTPKKSSSRKGSTRLTQMIKKFGSLRRSPNSPKMFSAGSEASLSRKSLLSSFRFSASTSAVHS
ncbi:hypothetical protein VP01_1438g3 [Puccinia sorghi]|uniref:Uncharacterized protein n=1 Tax=Puccinia sorghi TaxID=27349 RepID=A0A0L6VK91_9BASI|nr:hypothetical protein VP01_1438g3 [Puccinia sorghi]